jgi:hypothetical protein
MNFIDLHSFSPYPANIDQISMIAPPITMIGIMAIIAKIVISPIAVAMASPTLVSSQISTLGHIPVLQ